MKIRYTGNKPKKIITFGGKEYCFAPTCEFNPIFDVAIIDWLLHRDKNGLFVVAEVEDTTPSQTKPDFTKVETLSVPEDKPDMPEETKPKRGRPRKK